MKHGVRFWKKKLGRTPEHRKDLLRNMMTELIHHERITTTVAKATFVKHELEALINRAKRGTSEDWQFARDSLRSQEIVVPKLMQVLTERYRNIHGGYMRIVRNGYNSPGSDRAPKAIIELVNNPNDLVYGSAKVFGDKVLQQLHKVEGAKYRRDTIKLVDPITGKEMSVFKLTERTEMSGREKHKLTLKEVGIYKQLIKMRQSLQSYPKSRAADIRNAHLIPRLEFFERQHRYQSEVDEVRKKNRNPSPKYLDTIGKHGFTVTDTFKVVPKEGVVAPAELPRQELPAVDSFSYAEKTVDIGSPVTETALGSNEKIVSVERAETAPSTTEEDPSLTQRLLSRLGLGHFHSGRSKK
ncbi:54S ribosomal protein L8, mitochondrial [Batrachochytrium dendrobatidis]